MKSSKFDIAEYLDDQEMINEYVWYNFESFKNNWWKYQDETFHLINNEQVDNLNYIFFTAINASIIKYIKQWP